MAISIFSLSSEIAASLSLLAMTEWSTETGFSMTKLLNARLGFGPGFLGAGANVYQAPDTGVGGAMSEDSSTGQNVSMDMVWQHGAITQSSHDGWGPMGIVAYGRAPGSGEVDDANGLNAKPAPKRMRLKEYKTLLYAGIYSFDDLAFAKELIVKASPTGRAIFEAYDRFLEEEENKDYLDRNFEFIFPGGGTYAARTANQDRLTSWGSAISIEMGESIFALLHEIVHAMPLDQLPAELLRIPYRSPEQEGISFEDRFVRQIESAYHDEAISGLAEVILFDELRGAGAPLPKEGENGYVDHVRAMRDVYMNEGVEAYLDSELYIGRNHRIDYNVNRLMQMAILTLADPETLKDVTVSSVLAEGGIQVSATDGSKAAELLAAVNDVQEDPTPENIQAIMAHVPRMLQYVTLDPEVMVARVKEFFEAYSKGKNPRRGRGFLGKRDVTVGGLRLLGKARAVYNDYVQQSMRQASAVELKARGTLWKAAGLTKEEERVLLVSKTENINFQDLPVEDMPLFMSATKKLDAVEEREKDRIAAEEKKAEEAAAKEVESKKSFMERVYEHAKLTEEEIALHKEFERKGLTEDDLGEMYANGDERAERMRGVAEEVRQSKAHVRLDIEEEKFREEYGVALNELGMDPQGNEIWEIISCINHKRGMPESVQRAVMSGDVEAKELLAKVARIKAAKDRLDGKVAASEYEFRGGVDDNADAIDALWNMTLDLAQEAGGTRRDDLVARATFLREQIAEMPESGKLSGIPTYDDLLERYMGITANKADHEGYEGPIGDLSDAWDSIYDLHSAVVLRDKKEAAAILEYIASKIEGAFKEWPESGDAEDAAALGMEVPGIMAAVGRIMRMAWKFGLPVKSAYKKQLAGVARSMQTFLRSKSLSDPEFDKTGEVILHSEAFGARAQADYVSFFFDLLDTPGTKKLANDWARFFLGSPLGVFFYRQMHSSFDKAARAWKKDYKARGVQRAFEGHGFYHFFFPGTTTASDAGVYSERLGQSLAAYMGYDSYGQLIDHSKKVQKGKVKKTSIGQEYKDGWGKEAHETLTIPVSALPIEPSRLEGVIAYRGKDGAPRVDVAVNGFYASLFRAWGLLTALPHFGLDTREEMISEVGKILFQDPYGSGELTLHTSLRLYYAEMLAVHGDVTDADFEASSYKWPAEELHDPLPGEPVDLKAIERDFVHERAIASDMSSLVKAKIVLAVHNRGDHEGARKRVEDLHDYYRSIIHLRREGVYPDGMSRAAQAISQYPEYRDAAKGLLGLAVEHIEVFKNDEEIFPRALEWVIRSIDGAALPYDVRETLMSDLVRTVIPEVRETSGYSPQEMQLKAYHVSRVNDVIYERGLSAYLERYQSAQALLYNRTADLIDEYGGMATSDAMMRGRFLQAAMRVNRELTFTKPELVASRNVEKFERMDDDAAFQLDLADIFPDQLAAFDPDSPVAEWNPTYVRRGVPEPAASFAKIKEAIVSLSETQFVIARSKATKQSRSNALKNRDRHVGLQPPRDDNRSLETPSTKEGQYQQTLDVYSSFVRWEVDRAAASKPHNRQALENILEAYKKRVTERGQINEASDVTGLTKDDAHLVPKYAMGIGRMLSRRELMNLRDTLGIRSVAFAFDRLGSAFDEQTELSETDENIVLAALDARGPHEAQAKRELYLYTLIHDSATLKLKRRAAYNLALSFSQEETIARMIDAYEKSGDAKAEARFYQRIVGFWQLTGQLPSDYYLMLLDGAGNGTGDPLERLEELMRSNGVQPTPLDLELRYGWQRYYGRFIADCQACIDSGFQVPTSVIHRDQVQQYIIPLKSEPGRARSLVRELRIRHQNRIEEIEIAKANLPNIFLKQPPVVRFLLLSYFGELSGPDRMRLVQEMNELERAEGRAQTFMHFFQMAGLEKLGQALSTMVGIVPDADREVFAKLQDRVPAGSAVEVRETIEREQGERIKDMYSEFDDTPIASASIAEVYRACLKESGEEVYIKVIPASKRRKIIDTAARLRRVAANFSEHNDRFAMGLDVAGMLNWFADQLENQLNLRKEMFSASNFGGRHDALTPTYFTATNSMLVMRPLDGIKVTDLDASSPHRKAASRSVARTGVQAVLAGYYHADPHPGNIFVSEESGDISWLDFGTMGNLDSFQRKQLMDFFFTLGLGDVHAQRMAIEAMAKSGASYDGDALEDAIAGLDEMDMTERAARLIALAGEHHLFVQYQCSQAITNLLTIKGVVQQLDPQFDFVAVFNELMPSAYEEAQRGVDSARSAAEEKPDAREPEREATSVESLFRSEKAMSPVHARATALYDILDQHMDTLEAKMGEDDFADFDELDDEMVDLAESEPKSPTLKRGLNKIEDTLRKHLGDAIVDAALGD